MRTLICAVGLLATLDAAADTGAPVPPLEVEARTGKPFLAYVGDTVILNGTTSLPSDAELEFSWTQVSGPKVSLDDPSSGEPRFMVGNPGVHKFELVVSDGNVESAPSESYVVGLDRTASPGAAQTGCSHAPLAAGWLMGLGVLALRRRKSR